MSFGRGRVAIAVTRGVTGPGSMDAEPSEVLMDRVDAVTQMWGVRESPGGYRTVWAEVAIG